MERWFVLVDDPDSDLLLGEVLGQVLVGGFGCRPKPDPEFQRGVLTKTGRMLIRSGGWHLYQSPLRRLAEEESEAGYVE